MINADFSEILPRLQLTEQELKRELTDCLGSGWSIHDIEVEFQLSNKEVYTALRHYWPGSNDSVGAIRGAIYANLKCHHCGQIATRK